MTGTAAGKSKLRGVVLGDPSSLRDKRRDVTKRNFEGAGHSLQILERPVRTDVVPGHDALRLPDRPG